jgi:hypothetical protein
MNALVFYHTKQRESESMGYCKTIATATLLLCLGAFFGSLVGAWEAEKKCIYFTKQCVVAPRSETFSLVPEETLSLDIKTSLCMPANASLDLVRCDAIPTNRTEQHKKCLDVRINHANTTYYQCYYRVVHMVNVFKNYGFYYKSDGISTFYVTATYQNSLGRCFADDVDCIGNAKKQWVSPPTVPSNYYYIENNPGEYMDSEPTTDLAAFMYFLAALFIVLFCVVCWSTPASGQKCCQ